MKDFDDVYQTSWSIMTTGIIIDERSIMYIRHHDLYFWVINHSTTVVDLKLVVYSIKNLTVAYLSVLLLLKIKNNLFFIILVMISFTELFELTLLFHCSPQEMSV